MKAKQAGITIKRTEVTIETVSVTRIRRTIFENDIIAEEPTGEKFTLPPADRSVGADTDANSDVAEIIGGDKNLNGR
ncbi:MAG: hypothetical protein ABL999_11275 [Pyrinomonadaceae bacterium]